MKRVLIVTPNWPPVTYPDMQRVRMALPYMKACGWEPLIVRYNPAAQGGFKEPLLEKTVPADIRTWQVRVIPEALTGLFGLHHYGFRGLPSLLHLGKTVIAQEKPDLVFFSTNLVQLMPLGRYWKKTYGVPYMLDFQDPWVPEDNSGVRLPMGLKARLGRAIDRKLEPCAVEQASHIVSVSPSYVKTLSMRYPTLRPDQFTVLPFGAPESDFEFLKTHPLKQSVFDPQDGLMHWVYVGRGGQDMEMTIKAFFMALSDARKEDSAKWNRLRVHFVGTHYAPARSSTKPIERWAVELGVGDLVQEVTMRIGYLESLKCLQDAEALIVPGSIDPGYTASKIYPYILARKPMLAMFHENSTVCNVLRETGAGELVTFSTREVPGSLAMRVFQRWFRRWPLVAPSTDWDAFTVYSARTMTQRLCAAFDQAIGRSSR